MKAGWLGQMVGVSWGYPKEFKFCGKIIPAGKVPQWRPKMVNDAFAQDDLYVEMRFLRTLEVYGLNSSIRQAGVDFANSEYPLWCANATGRTNLRKGIAPPDSSHPRFNKNADDIDDQIEADYSGLIAPGMPNLPIELGEKFGRLMNYGDAMYAGQFVGGMYAEAFFEDDIVKVIEAALRCIPAEVADFQLVFDPPLLGPGDPLLVGVQRLLHLPAAHVGTDPELVPPSVQARHRRLLSEVYRRLSLWRWPAGDVSLTPAKNSYILVTRPPA